LVSKKQKNGGESKNPLFYFSKQNLALKHRVGTGLNLLKIAYLGGCKNFNSKSNSLYACISTTSVINGLYCCKYFIMDILSTADDIVNEKCSAKQAKH